MAPFCSAAAIVTGLSVLPGANTSSAAMSPWAVVAMPDGSLGLYVGYWAMARTLPVCGCMTTIEQLRALAFFTSCWHACSASYWMLALMVRSRFFARTGAVTLSVVFGIGTPSVPGLDFLAAVAAGQQGVVLLLEPGFAGQVAGAADVGEADQARGQLAVGI